MARVRSLDEQRQRDMDRLGLQYRAVRPEAGEAVQETSRVLGPRRGAAHLAVQDSLRLMHALDVHQWSTASEAQRGARAALVQAREALEQAERAIVAAARLEETA